MADLPKKVTLCDASGNSIANGQATAANSIPVTLASDKRIATDAGVYSAGRLLSAQAFDVALSDAPSRGLVALADGAVSFETRDTDGTTVTQVSAYPVKAGDVVPFAIYKVLAESTTLTTAQILLGW